MGWQVVNIAQLFPEVQGSFPVLANPMGHNQRFSRLEGVLNNSELRARPHRTRDPGIESKAFRFLARVMANSPQQLGDTLVRLALELCRAGTAGISLVETVPGSEPISRWTSLAGLLKKDVGGFTPQNFNRCGVSLDRRAPQLFLCPARHFPFLNDFPVPFVEALVVPLMGPGPAGAIWIFSHEEGMVFDSEDVRLLTDLADFTSSALRVIRLLDAERSARLHATNELARQTAELKVQVAERKMAEENLMELTGSLLQLRDEEHRRVARELHDSVGQFLVAMSMNQGRALAEKHLSPMGARAISENTAILAQVSREIRTISHLLYPPLLDEVGLAPGIREYLEGFAERSRMKVQFEIAEDFGRLPRDLETALFRIVQEGLTNVHRHSESRTVTIRIVRSSRQVSLAIADSGTGIPRQKVREIEAGRASGVGLRGMRERVRQLGGSFRIRSSHKGTVVAVRLPLEATTDSGQNDFVAPAVLVAPSSLSNPESWRGNQIPQQTSDR
ncbi:MAG: GAF domain-containing sensor histidine kinase [Candidatus Sulfotelmatobacter sp.]